MILPALLLMTGQAIPLPPFRFQNDTITTVEFGKVQERCGHLATNGQRVLACANGSVMVVPHPCQSSGEFAKIVCHELGHRNGWPVDHPR